MLTPVSDVSSAELVTLSPPQISPPSQLSETASDTSTSAPEVPEAGAPKVPETAESTESDGHEEKSNEEAQTDDDPKKSKAHLHCPVCKVTVNSISQLEAHNSGKNAHSFPHKQQRI